jgi:hypothetical protein
MSKEYFGYARMESSITIESYDSDYPQIITNIDAPANKLVHMYTSSTEVAPRGRITHNLSRETMFWEAKLSEDDEIRGSETSSADDDECSPHSHVNMFRVKWKSIVRLPFHKTRGMRNSWNSNREIKIARDGTEIEPGIGKQLVQLIHDYGPQIC